MDLFSRNLKKVLTKRLKTDSSFSYSQRYEGKMDYNEETVPHKFVTIIIDNEIDEGNYKAIANKLFDFLKTDKFFKESKYQIRLWKQEQFILTPEKKVDQRVRLIKQYLDNIVLDGTPSGSWDNFMELYEKQGHKRAGEILFVTTQEKIESLEQQQISLIRNMVILYPGSFDTPNLMVIKRIPCISHNDREDMQKSEIINDDTN